MNKKRITRIVFKLISATAIALPLVSDAADVVLFSQDTFGNNAALVAEGWITGTEHIIGRNDPDGKNALTLGWSAYIENARRDTDITVEFKKHYFVQFDVRMTQTFGDPTTWVNNDPDDRDLTYTLLDAGSSVLVSEIYTISAVVSTSQWITVRSEYSDTALGAGSGLTLRFDKNSWGGGQEAIWIDNIKVGETDPPGTTIIIR